MVVTYVEFVRYWSKRGRDMDTIKKMFKSLDVNNDGVLTGNEY